MFQDIKRKITFICFCSTLWTAGYTQDHFNRTLDWENTNIKDINNQILPNISFKGAMYDSHYPGIPFFIERFQTMGRATIVNEQYAPFTLTLTPEALEKIENNVIVQSAISLERKIPYLSISILPLRKNPSTGLIEKLINFDIKITKDNNFKSGNLIRPYTNTSVLNSGTWYKLGVNKTGIHIISYNDLQNMGIDVNAIDPRDIRIYGNGGGYLPELNSDPRIDDLVENPIKVIGENDGKFDKNDYILFYAGGPTTWKLNNNSKLFYHENHPYSDKTFYFLTTSLGTGKRIITKGSSSSPVNLTINTFNDYLLHEIERSTAINRTIKSGRERFGEEFNNLLSYDFNFNFPNLEKTIPVKIQTSLFGRSQSPVSSSFVIKANGQTINTVIAGGTSFDYDQPYGNLITSNPVNFSSSLDNIQLNITYNKPNSSALGFLNYIELNAVRKLVLSGQQMSFRNIASVGPTNISLFQLETTNPNVEIWDITTATDPQIQASTNQGGVLSFITETPILKEFIAVTGNEYYQPSFEGIIANQNLHGIGQPDMVILTHPDFLYEAERLAQFRRQNSGLDVFVITPDKIYNEFSSGAQDASAIRDFMKMLYDRAGNDQSKMPQYLLLLGDGSYDNKNILNPNTNFLPTFESRNSIAPLGSYVSDDYYGLLDDIEGGWDLNNNFPPLGQNALDIAVGRLPVRTAEEARQVIDKIIHYSSSTISSTWKNNYVLIADDEDNNRHFNDAEDQYELILDNTKRYDVDKIYLDAYPQISTPAGNRYPAVNNAINQRMNSGALVVNYIGHGGITGLGHEQVMMLDDINSWKNIDNMPLMVTATCSFSHWDDPEFQSAGEQSLLNPKGGAIALFTTTRVVYAQGNKLMNENFIDALFAPANSNSTQTLGDVFRVSKNINNVGLSSNNRNFTLLGDPSLPFARPSFNVITEKVNDTYISNSNTDTLKALSKVTISGYVTDKNGNKITNYNGVLFPVVYDKKSTLQTLAQDQGSIARTFELQKNIIYKGRASIKNGEFSYTFVVPKDISYQPGLGRLSYYATTNIQNLDANGNYDSVIVGGSNNKPITDLRGPEMKIFLNDENFAFGGTTNEDPILIVKLKDENGINTVGNGIGHNLVGTLIKENDEQTIDLNQYYESKLDNYQEGEIRYPLYNLASGKYKLKVKAWDVFNNSSENTTEFVVKDSKKLAIDHVLNYPNPFTTHTDFQFEHNRPGDPLDVQVQIFTISGKLLKTIQADINTPGSRVTNIKWNGRDEFGDKIGRGVYIYCLKVRSSDGSTADKYEKLVILN